MPIDEILNVYANIEAKTIVFGQKKACPEINICHSIHILWIIMFELQLFIIGISS